MKDAKGIEKFADEYLVGIIGFIYSALATIFFTFWKPRTIFGRSRDATKDAIRILPSSVALLLYIFPVFYLQKWVGDPTQFIEGIELSGLNWYEKLIVITTLYIFCDCVVRTLGWLVSRDVRHRRTNCERLRYAAAAFVVAVDALSIVRPFDAGPLPVVVFTLVASYPAGALLGTMLCIRFRLSMFVAGVILAYIASAVVIWGSALAVGLASISFGALVSKQIEIL